MRDFIGIIDTAIWLGFVLTCILLFAGDPDIADGLREIVLKKAGLK